MRGWPLGFVVLTRILACSSGESATSPTSPTLSSPGGTDDAAIADASTPSDAAPDPGTTLAAGKTTRTIAAASHDRSVIVVVPSGVGPFPLVIALHGNGDTNEGFISQTTNLESLAASKGFVLAAPQGITQTIMVQGQTVPGVDWDPYRSTADGNIDLPLLEAIRTDLGASSSIDPKHVIVFGYSQGGYMSFRYGMDQSASLACAGLIGAANPLGPQLTASAPRKIPVALQIGTADGAIGQARSTKDDLTQKSFPLDYHEIAGAGHIPVAGGVTTPLTYCLAQSLP